MSIQFKRIRLKLNNRNFSNNQINLEKIGIKNNIKQFNQIIRENCQQIYNSYKCDMNTMPSII